MTHVKSSAECAFIVLAANLLSEGDASDSNTMVACNIRFKNQNLPVISQEQDGIL